MTDYSCPHCGWDGDKPRDAGAIAICPDCLQTGLVGVQ